jgi:hypothetical protein
VGRVAAVRVVLRCGCSVEIGEKELEPPRDGVDVSGLCEERQLCVETCDLREKRGRER